MWQQTCLKMIEGINFHAAEKQSYILRWLNLYFFPLTTMNIFVKHHLQWIINTTQLVLICLSEMFSLLFFSWSWQETSLESLLHACQTCIPNICYWKRRLDGFALFSLFNPLFAQICTYINYPPLAVSEKSVEKAMFYVLLQLWQHSLATWEYKRRCLKLVYIGTSLK